MPMPDYTTYTGRTEPRVIEQAERYGYYPLQGQMVRDSWIVAFDKPGAIGPFSMTRMVSITPWVLDPADPRASE